jgi:hypothetical protein
MGGFGRKDKDNKGTSNEERKIIRPKTVTFEKEASNKAPARKKREKKVSVQAYVSEAIKEEIVGYAEEDITSESNIATKLILKGLEVMRAERNPGNE